MRFSWDVLLQHLGYTQTLAGQEMVGRWTGVQNFVGNFAGAVAPWITGFLLDRTGHFYWVFLVTTAVVWVGAVSRIFVVGPIKPVEWRRHPPSRNTLPLCLVKSRSSSAWGICAH